MAVLMKKKLSLNIFYSLWILEIYDEFTKIVSENLKHMNKLKKIMEYLKNDCEDATIRGSITGNLEVRVKTGMNGALTDAARELMEDFFKKQTMFKESQTKKVKHDIKLFTSKTDQELGLYVDEMGGVDVNLLYEILLKIIYLSFFPLNLKNYQLSRMPKNSFKRF